MTDNKIKQLVVSVIERENKETGEKFNTYKVSTAKGALYDLKFTKSVPEEIRPTVSSVLFANLEDIDFQEKNRSFPIVWVKGIIGSMPLESNKSKVDSMFKDVKAQENEEDEEDEEENEPETQEDNKPEVKAEPIEKAE